MKKFLCLMLTLAILTGLAAPALAADAGADARLTAVTNKVKATLGLDTDGYDSFYGNLNEQLLVPVWSLNWSGTGGSLSIQADEDGRILSYYYYDAAESNDYPTRYAPTFPKGKEETARAAATAFLKKVLDSSTESVVLKADSTLNLGATSFSYWGTLLINGLPSPFQYGISVRASDNTVRSFYRDSLGTKLLGGIPSASTGVDAGAAGDLLKATLDLRLEYVASDNGKKAVLRWLPTGRDEYYVDAKTGELVNLTELYAQFSGGSGYGNLSGGATADSATSEAGTKRLTEAELTGIAKLEGVQSKEALDALLRKIAPLGLSNYSLSTANFWLGQSDDSVSCSLQYTRELKGQIWRRYITVDAKTGTLQSVYSSIPWFEKESDRPSATVDSAKAEALARAFLKTYYPNDYAKLALYTAEDEMSIYGGSNSDSFTFRFCQQENGYFYANNYYTVSIDAADGSVSAFYFNFDGDITFDSTEGLLSKNAALDAYFKTFQVQLGYQAIPQQLDPSVPEVRPLIDMGYSYLYALKLTYSLAQEDYVSGIDAKTGKPVLPSSSAPVSISYSDLSGHWVKDQAEALAKYNVGWLGGTLSPAKILTQFDALCLLVSVNGYLYDDAGGKEGVDVDQVYSMAYRMGLLKPDQRNDSQSVSRGELVKLILNAGGYGEVAGLKGIFLCSFQDAASIPAEYYGYAALAQGLGLVGGDGKGSFAAGRTATRAEATVMLYNLMNR